MLLNYLPASRVPWCVEQVRRGGNARIYANIHVGVGDRAAAAPQARYDLFSYAVVDAYARSFTRAGFGDAVQAIRAAHRRETGPAPLAAVPDEMVDAINVIGDGIAGCGNKAELPQAWTPAAAGRRRPGRRRDMLGRGRPKAPRRHNRRPGPPLVASFLLAPGATTQLAKPSRLGAPRRWPGRHRSAEKLQYCSSYCNTAVTRDRPTAVGASI